MSEHHELSERLRQIRPGVQYNDLNELEAAHASAVIDKAADALDAEKARADAAEAEVARLRMMYGAVTMETVVQCLHDPTAAEVKLAAIEAELVELDACHQPEWASEQAKAAGKEPWVCVICGPSDGGWPCTSRMVADAIARILHPDAKESPE